MEKRKNILLITFASIGIICLAFNAYNFFTSQKEARIYRKNCDLIKVGMSLQDAKKIMGDYDWFKKSTRSEIWIEHQNIDSLRSFYLSYPTFFIGATWPKVYFDPNTMKVTKVICGGE
ncbi:MAG: hypothetical protein ACKO96_18050 [Flammeovirgaceae bacterium]